MSKQCAACLCDDLEMHEHHLVPRSLGGEKGPTASLCSNCHSLVHKAASSKLKSLAEIEDEGHRFRVAQMAAIILRAEDAVKNDPNRSVTIQDRLPAELSRMVSDLAKLYGTSRKVAIRTAVRQEHARWFGHGRKLKRTA